MLAERCPSFLVACLRLAPVNRIHYCLQIDRNTFMSEIDTCFTAAKKMVTFSHACRVSIKTFRLHSNSPCLYAWSGALQPDLNSRMATSV